MEFSTGAVSPAHAPVVSVVLGHPSPHHCVAAYAELSLWLRTLGPKPHCLEEGLTQSSDQTLSPVSKPGP